MGRPVVTVKGLEVEQFSGEPLEALKASFGVWVNVQSALEKLTTWVSKKGKKPQPTPTQSGRGFPRFWNLFAYLLPRKVRERVYEPAHQELLEDYLTARKKYRTKWSRRWLTFCFTFRTVLMVLDSFRAMLGDHVVDFLVRLLPEALRQWWVRKP
jgi:hypothetical protein